jgi:nucleoside phosphorylase
VKIIQLVVALTIFIGSACVVALSMVLLVRYGLGVPPAALRLNALISAGALSLVVVVAIAGGADEREK